MTAKEAAAAAGRIATPKTAIGANSWRIDSALHWLRTEQPDPAVLDLGKIVADAEAEVERLCREYLDAAS